MDLKTSERQPGAREEEGELEDGEICDDETEEKLPLKRGEGSLDPRAKLGRRQRKRPVDIPPLIDRDLRPLLSFPHGLPHGPPALSLRDQTHGPPHSTPHSSSRGLFPLDHRQQQCGPSGPDRPDILIQQTPEHDLAPQRSNFWERSHCALGRFRHSRGEWRQRGGGNHNSSNNWAQGGRYISAENHGNRNDSPNRKHKPMGRNQPRKLNYAPTKPESSTEETFEDLLSRYKQIQLELECIRKEETMALETKLSPARETLAQDSTTNVCVHMDSNKEPTVFEEGMGEQKKVFQAFNIKPLRQKVPANLDELKKKWEEEAETTGDEIQIQDGEQTEHQNTLKKEKKDCISCNSDSDSDAKLANSKPGTKTENEGIRKEEMTKDEMGSNAIGISCEEQTHDKQSMKRESSVSSVESNNSTDKPKMEEEELSELQLRLLALQSASKKWHQQEKQVMKKSKERMSKPVQDKSTPSCSGPITGRQRNNTKPIQEKSSSSSPNNVAAANRQRVTTRSSTATLVPPAERARTRSRTNSQDQDKGRMRPGARSTERDYNRTGGIERDRPKQSPKPGPKPIPKLGASKTPADRGRSNLNKTQNASKKITPASSKQAVRRQQLRNWKLKQQREEDERRRQEEEERRKREEEIRRIRDLSNQDEQYNRFMKLVGGKTVNVNKLKDRDYRKSTGKSGLDTSGNLYQYDNYDEVAMDTDSETSSPVPSPIHNPFTGDFGGFPQSVFLADSVQFGMDISQLYSVPAPPPPPPLPPPDEMEPPPKPPFADEEEEEEMLLRETCLMSMANKRVAPVGGRVSSGPLSSQPLFVQPPNRENLSAVSLNTVPAPKNKFNRGHNVPRAPLVLPRHKAVVVSLNDSDDSDSDGDTSAQGVFGGLEFMIREARRTVEATKPKGTSEKENNPMRTPEALPEAKKAEYRLLKEEIASREKQKMLSAWNSVSQTDAVENNSNKAAEQQLTEAEQKLNKHRELLKKDEALLKDLLQQEVKKRESLRAAETKVCKLREQLQASEKIAHANKTLLKKLQEQVHRVEHRVSLKKTVAVKLEQELNQAQAGVKVHKRKQESSQLKPSKVQRLEGAERHFAELIAQKQRLQQLESEYALKIQKLKAAQALRNKTTSTELQHQTLFPLQVSTSQDIQNAPIQAQIPPPTSPFPVSQPSLHDLTQDKLTLDTEDEQEESDNVQALSRKSERRPSFRQSTSFTKPNLEQLTSTPAKDINASPNVSTDTCTKRATGTSKRAELEVFAGFDMDSLKERYQQQPQLGELLQTELEKTGQDLQASPVSKVPAFELDAALVPSGASDLKPVPYGPYHSSLLVFKSYRFSPYYRTKEKLSLSSATYSNTIDPKKHFCRFDLTGTCNDDGCKWQHMRNVTLNGGQLFQDILSYDLSLIGCTDKSSDKDISVATEKYIKKLFGPNNRMSTDQKAVLLVSKVNESKKHTPPYTTFKDLRRWKPKAMSLSTGDSEESSDGDEPEYSSTLGKHESGTDLGLSDVCVTSEDKRYFFSETDDISNLETSVSESPCDTQLWIKLAFKYLNQPDVTSSECLEAALNTLSRALENNCDNPEVWSQYLSLFSKRGSRAEVQEMCEMAVEHASHYCVWWTYLSLERTFEGKDSVSERLLQFLVSEAPSSGQSEKLSFQILEAVLYRVQLSAFSGRTENALQILQNWLQSAVADDLMTPGDRALLWLCLIHLSEFQRLPSSLFDTSVSGPARLVSRDTFILPWRTAQDICSPLDKVVSMFQAGISHCSDDSLSPSERTIACLPLHTNLLNLYKVLHRCDEAILLCEALLQFCPESCVLREALAELHVAKGDANAAANMWLHALVECPDNAEVFYHSCKFLIAQEKSNALAPLFRGFILSLCEDEEESQKKPVDVLRHILGFPCEDLLKGPVIKKELQEQLLTQMPFLHLLHCQWQWLYGSPQNTVEAFERALGTSLQLEELHRLWTDYLLFSSSQQQQTRSSCKSFSDLILRCLSSVPSRLEVPFNPAEFWSCYKFHNQVVSMYLGCLPPSQHSLVLERLRYSMPNNTELGLRLLHQEWMEGNFQHLKFQSRMLSSHAPRCLANWKIAIAVEKELSEKSEVRRLYQQALNQLPLCAALWKDRLLFEAAEGGRSDRLRSLVDRCQELGVSLNEQLSKTSRKKAITH